MSEEASSQPPAPSRAPVACSPGRFSSLLLRRKRGEGEDEGEGEAEIEIDGGSASKQRIDQVSESLERSMDSIGANWSEKAGQGSTALARRSAVVFTDLSLERAIKYDDYCMFDREVNNFLSNPKEYGSSSKNDGDAQARDQLECVLECLDKERCETFEDCVMWALVKFEDYFSNCVKQLIYTFPEDAATSTGAPFRSAPQRFPQPLEFSTDDPAHLLFIMVASRLRAQAFGITAPDWAMPLNFDPRKIAKIVTDKATSVSTVSADDAAVITKLISKLYVSAKMLPSGYRMNPIQFEKLSAHRSLCNRLEDSDLYEQDFHYSQEYVSSGTTILAFICEKGMVGVLAAESRLSWGNMSLGTFGCGDDYEHKINPIIEGRIYAAFSGGVKDSEQAINLLKAATELKMSTLYSAADVDVRWVVKEAQRIIQAAGRRSKIEILILGWDERFGMNVYGVNSVGDIIRDMILTFGSGARSIAVQSWSVDFTEDEARHWIRRQMDEAIYFDDYSGGSVRCVTLLPDGKFRLHVDGTLKGGGPGKIVDSEMETGGHTTSNVQNSNCCQSS